MNTALSRRGRCSMTARRRCPTPWWPMLLLLSALIVTAQTGAPEKGPRLGETIPSFQARDQFGRTQTLRTLTGPRGLVLLFVRSADW